MQTPPKTASEPETEALECPKLARPKRLKRTLSVAFPEELDISDKVEAKAEEATNELPDPTVSDYAKAEARYAAMDETAKDEAAKAEDAKVKDAKANTTNEASAITADFVASLYAHNFVERIMSVLKSKRISPAALIDLCDELEVMPYVELPSPSNSRERCVSHILLHQVGAQRATSLQAGQVCCTFGRGLTTERLWRQTERYRTREAST
jgi:hypothetical protein